MSIDVITYGYFKNFDWNITLFYQKLLYKIVNYTFMVLFMYYY